MRERLAAVRVLETEAIPGLEENETLTTRSFEVGQIGLPDLLLIRREILDTRSQYLDALAGGGPRACRSRCQRGITAMTTIRLFLFCRLRRLCWHAAEAPTRPNRPAAAPHTGRSGDGRAARRRTP